MSEMLMGGDVGALAGALAKAQGEMGHAKKNGVNPHFKSDYSTLVDLHNAAYPHLSANGLSVVQVGIPGGIRTILLHTGGGYVAGDMTAEGRDASAQSVGSVITYLRRYGFAAAVGLSSGDDDDGEAAQPTRGQPVEGSAYEAKMKKLEHESRRDVREAQPVPAGQPTCPKCGKSMFDNRATKKNPKAPDFKCRDREHCDGVYWPGQWPPKEPDPTGEELWSDDPDLGI